MIFMTTSSNLLGNDYLPSTYLIFALWGLPLKLLGLMTSFFSNPSLGLKNKSWARNAIFACALSYAFLFVTIAWHPQRMFILMPFFALSVIYIRHQKAFLFF